jgi:hypothetical protein
MTYSLTDAQRSIIAVEIDDPDAWANAKWTLGEGNTEGSGDAVVEQAIANMQEYQNTLSYARLRRMEYPDVGDQLDDLYRQGAFSDEMAATLAAVKEKHPKG